LTHFLSCAPLLVLDYHCRPYLQGQDDNIMKTVHRYSIRGWRHEEERKENEYNDSQMLQRFIEVVNSQSKYNQNGTINAIPTLQTRDNILFP
jgi:hypothetical protein